MTSRQNLKALFIEVPEKEFKKFKVFAASNGITMQTLVRSSVNYFIKDVEKERAKKSNEKR